MLNFQAFTALAGSAQASECPLFFSFFRDGFIAQNSLAQATYSATYFTEKSSGQTAANKK
jgi:hypothetical protein